jgi:thiol:disulfide interchange protein DsbD
MAKALNKPMLLDFTGYGCVNCRRMEEKVWSQPDVLEVMRSQFVVVSLYVDDKAKLPANQRFTYLTKAGAEKDIVTVGDKWATFETENFENNAQPLYAIVSPNEVLLNRPVGNTPVAADYLKWLQCGLAAFKQVSK